MSVSTIKCGKNVYELEDGETVMDNGACLQLLTRDVRKGWQTRSPRVSKAAFKAFKADPNVSINTGHSYGAGVTLWTYNAPSTL
jgi:hypothetical protein